MNKKMNFYFKLIMTNEVSLIPKPSLILIFLLKEFVGLIVHANWDCSVKHIVQKLLIILWIF
jgi:hypothetical protein